MSVNYEAWRDGALAPDASGVREIEPIEQESRFPDVYAEMEDMLQRASGNEAIRPQVMGLVNQKLREQALNVRYGRSEARETADPGLAYAETLPEGDEREDIERQAGEMLDLAETQFVSARDRLFSRIQEFAEYDLEVEQATWDDLESLAEDQPSMDEFEKAKKVVKTVPSYEPSREVSFGSNSVVANNVDFALGLKNGEVKSIDDYLKPTKKHEAPAVPAPDAQRDLDVAAHIAQQKAEAAKRFGGLAPQPVSKAVSDLLRAAGRNNDGSKIENELDTPEL